MHIIKALRHHAILKGLNTVSMEKTISVIKPQRAKFLFIATHSFQFSSGECWGHFRAGVLPDLILHVDQHLVCYCAWVIDCLQIVHKDHEPC